MRTERFELLLTSEEKELLVMIAKIEHISAAAVIRRLIWQEAEGKRLTVTEESEMRKVHADSDC
jgi:hypothetical protein